jgi:hypothetical protein
MILPDVLRCVLYNIVCPCWFWPWYCLTFFDVFCTTFVIQNTSKNVRQYHGQNQQGQTILGKIHRRTSDNTMAKTNNNKQCCTKHIEERQTIPWPKPTRTNNVIQNTSKNVKQYHEHCLSLLVLAMVLSDVLRCVLYNIVCPCWFWPWYCLTFFDVFCITLFVLVGFANKDKQCYTKHIEERQTIPWLKPTRTNNVVQNTSKNLRQYHGQNQQGQTMLYKTHRRTSDNAMTVFCITLFVLVGFGHGIV